MPVDKFGRNDDRTTTVYTEINIANLSNSFLRRDGGNTAIGAIDTNSHIITNVADPLSNQDIATKIYVHKNAIITAGCVVSGDIKLNVGSDLVRCLGCNEPYNGQEVYTSARVRHKCAIIFLTQFTIKSSYQDKNRWKFYHVDKPATYM